METVLRTAVEQLPETLPSRTVVLEAACHLVCAGKALHVPGFDLANATVARAFRVMAVGLQRYMLRYWYERTAIDGTLLLEEERDPEEFLFAFIGPGGTGKTTVLKSIEALIDHG